MAGEEGTQPASPGGRAAGGLGRCWWRGACHMHEVRGQRSAGAPYSGASQELRLLSRGKRLRGMPWPVPRRTHMEWSHAAPPCHRERQQRPGMAVYSRCLTCTCNPCSAVAAGIDARKDCASKSGCGQAGLHVYSSAHTGPSTACCLHPRGASPCSTLRRAQPHTAVPCSQGNMRTPAQVASPHTSQCINEGNDVFSRSLARPPVCPPL